MPQSGALETIVSIIIEALEPLVGVAQASPPGSGVVTMGLDVGVDLSGVMDPATSATFATGISNAYDALLTLAQDPAGFADKIPQALQAISDFKTVIDVL